MIVVHASFASGSLRLWAETSTDRQTTAARKAPGRPARAAARPHPFAASVAALRNAFDASGGKARAKPESATIWLPTAAGRPVGSEPLLGAQPADGAPVELAPWQVQIESLGAAATINLLTGGLDSNTLGPGVFVGQTLRYWADALRYAGALVTRGQILPGLEQRDNNWFARWRTAVTGTERARLARLAAAMPPACRALTLAGDDAPTRPAAAVLVDFLNVVVDLMVRGTIGFDPSAPLDSVHDHWLHALGSRDGLMEAAPTDTAAFAEQLRTWERPVAVANQAAYRLCFRLEEPAEAAGPEAITDRGEWTVRYLLQAEDDPSLLVPLTDAWAPKRRTTAALRGKPIPGGEFLLTALGQAALLSPEIDASLRSAAPDGFATDTAGAHHFLTETAWLLEGAGFGVLLPAWWARTGSKNRLAVTAHAQPRSRSSSSGPSVLSLEEMVKFEWRVALGDTELTLKELEALARLKAPLVRLRGRWVQVNAEEIRSAIDFWKKKAGTEGTVRDAVKLALGAAEAPGGLRVRGVRASGWLKDFLDRLEGQREFAEQAPPAGFQGTLRPYQQRGYSWLTFLRQWGLGACLADDMGLGKSAQALAALQHAREEGETRPVLLVCPTSVVGHWRREAERFTPSLSVLVHHGLKRTRGQSFAAAAAKHAVVVSSYPLLLRDAELFRSVQWAGVILDEAQNVKNPNAKQSQAARELTADYRVALTGTPVENHVGDLWAIWQFLNPGFLGSREAFRRNFQVPIQVQRDDEAAARLKQLTGPFLLRRLKTDKTVIADLPEKLEAKVFCNLTREQASLYEAVARDLERSLSGEEEGIRRKGLVLGALSKLKQVCNHPAQFLGDNSPIPGRSGKLARLTEMLDEVLQAGDRAIVFTQFTEMGEIIRKHLEETFGREVLFLHGGVPRKQRDAMVARFQDVAAADAPRIFLVSLKAGGTGLTLTAANHVFHFDRWWNPAVEDQATDRAFRIGQKRNVQVYKFVCAGTLEEKIDEMIELKKEVAGRVVGTGEGWLTQLSNAQLRDLLTLRADAVGE